MTITIPPEIEAQLLGKARAAGITAEAYVERPLREDEQWGVQLEEPLNEGDPEFEKIRAAVMEGLEQAEHGEGRPANEVFAKLRAKYGIPR